MLTAGDHHQLPAEVYDISRSGISLLVEHPFSPGTRVHVDTGHLAAEGVVARCDPRGNQHCVGIQFDPPAVA